MGTDLPCDMATPGAVGRTRRGRRRGGCARASPRRTSTASYGPVEVAASRRSDPDRCRPDDRRGGDRAARGRTASATPSGSRARTTCRFTAASRSPRSSTSRPGTSRAPATRPTATRAAAVAPGVCITTSGPGVLNLAASIGTAHADSVPMLVVAPGMSGSVAGRDTGHLHEARDQLGALAGVAGSAVRAAVAGAGGRRDRRGFRQFASGRPRPAYVEIPLDVDVDAVGEVPGVEPGRLAARRPSRAQIDRAARPAPRSAHRAAIVLGGGAAGRAAQALELARLLGAPVVTTANGKGTSRSATRSRSAPRSGSAGAAVPRRMRRRARGRDRAGRVGPLAGAARS